MEEGADIPNDAAKSSVTERLKSLLNSLVSGDIQSLSDFQSRSETTTEKALVKWASLLRSFDENLYEHTLQLVVPDGSPHMSFDEFSRSLNVEPVPRADRIFRVKDEVQQANLNEWGRELVAPKAVAGQPPLADTPFFQNLLSNFTTDKEDHDLDLLGILILTDPLSAEEKFLKLVEEAEGNFDLARYNDLVKLLEDRVPLLSPALLKLCQQHRQYLNARNLFARDYYQTGFYYARQSVVQAFDDLLKDSSKESEKWIFHLYATGGMGKTMFVKWLISRHFLPRRIPVARLDFDYLDLRTVSRYPWLMILEIASQLNQQIAVTLFNEILSSNGRLLSLLRPRGEAQTDRDRANLEEEAQSSDATLSYTLVNRFADGLRESGFQESFVVAFDTLEVIDLRHKRSLMAVLRGLAAIRHSYPQMRLLLSGRYNLLERLKEFNTLFAQQTLAHELKPFTTKESRLYLTQKRELKNGSIVNAIIQKCEGSSQRGADGQTLGSNPFKLSLFADLYQQKEVKTAQDILNYPRTDFAYLIDRIIERIKEPEVQWLLRYAVVPRQFNFDFFEKVIAHHLEAELIRKRKLDEVNKKYPKGAEVFENQEKFKSVKRARSLNIKAIWRNLRQYASNYGWISFDSGDDSAPRLQPDVVTPMRVLLKEQEIFKPLHSDAADYFAEKASQASDQESDPKQWAQLILEAIYHRFQLEGEKAADYWRLQIDALQSQTDPSIRKMIAEEITGKDYAVETDEPLQKEEEQSVVSPSVLCEARLRTVEASIASIVNLKASERTAEWVNIKEHLDEVREVYKRKIREPESYAKPLDFTVVFDLASQMQETKINYRAVVPLLRSAISTTESKQMLLSLEILLADSLAIRNNKESFIHYSKALRLWQRLKYPHVKTSQIRLRMALWHYYKSDFIVAESRFRKVLSLAKRDDNHEVRLSALRYLADVNIELGRYEQAVQFLEQIKATTQGLTDGEERKEEGQPLQDALFLSHIQGRILYEPLRALSGIQPYFDSVITDRERAALNELQGDIFGKLMKFDEALSLIEDAKALWGKVSEVFGIDRAKILRIELQLLEIGNLIVADSQLKRIKKSKSEIYLELDTHSRLLRVLWHYRSGDRSKARDEWQLLTKNKNMRESPRSFVRTLAMGLALGLSNESTVKEFIRELKKIKLVSARLTLLGAFEYAETPFEASPGERAAIKRLLNIRSVGKDRIPHALLRADALDRCGETALAKRIIDRAGQEALKLKNSFAYRNVLLAKDRLGVTLSEKDDLYASGFFRDFAEYPNLCAAGHIEQAERLLRRGQLQACKKSLGLAQELLSQTKLTTRWHAKLNELFGEVTGLEGDRRPALRSYNAALSVYEQLGNKPAVERLRAKLPFISQELVTEEEVFTIRMRETPRTLTVESIVGDKLEFESKPSGKEIEDLLRLSKADIKDRTAIYVFAKMLMSNTIKVKKSFGEILVPKNLAARLRGKSKEDRAPVMRLDSLSLSLAKMPWELAQFEGRTMASLFHYFYRSGSQTSRNLENVKWLQFALRELVDPTLLADGVLGLKTNQALETLKKKYKIPGRLSGTELTARIGNLLVSTKSKRKAKALLIRPPQERQIKSQRHVSSGSPLIEWMYRDFYFATETTDSLEPDSLKRLLASFHPDVIHIQSSFREIHQTGQIYLDFGYTEPLYSPSKFTSSSGGGGGRSFNQLSAAPLNDALALLPRTKLRPLVILDAISPIGTTETIHQLIYRNNFASELFQLGNVSGIIAMGLTMDNELRETLAYDLISGLSNTVTFGGIVDAMKKNRTSHALDHEIPTLGIALFTNEPSLTILSPDK